MTSTTVPHDTKYFQELLKEIRNELLPKIPTIDAEKKVLLHTALVSVKAAQSSLQETKKAQAAATTDEEKKATSAAVQAAERALEDARNVALEASTPILDDLTPLLLQNDSLDTLFVKASILSNATKQLVEYCKKGEIQSNRIDNLLSDTNQMRQMLVNGGAKGGNFGQACEIYENILALLHDNDKSTNSLLQQLALATSLELALPKNEFDIKTPINAVERFQHYQQAHENDQLDATFATQSTWNLRWVVNNDAPNDQLAWGRTMLRNYRPDIITRQDYKWKYVWIVRSDVSYNTPQWTSSPHTYQQMLSGGGKCGPRAWFGRFALQCHGIPTWGVRQPGHAALGHWCARTEEWVICLGAAWKFSTWEGRDGLDFVLEANARRQSHDYIGVCRLEWVADAIGEQQINGKLNPDYLWRSLALFQKQHLARREPPNVDESKHNAQVCGIAERLSSTTNLEPIVFKNDGRIIVPAVACTKPTKPSPNAIFSQSILGGMQLHIRGDTTVEFRLSLQETQRYKLVIQVVTVHLKMQPLLLTITSTEKSQDVVMVSSIVVPYTVGEWGETDPVEIELQAGTNVLSFARESPKHGLTMKELVLTPMVS